VLVGILSAVFMYACTEAKETSHSRRCCPTLYIDIDVDVIYVYMYNLNMSCDI
jgi:hypothetical protein